MNLARMLAHMKRLYKLPSARIEITGMFIDYILSTSISSYGGPNNLLFERLKTRAICVKA